jgi:predicted enzyme related to lactoylglutathione lyase
MVSFRLHEITIDCLDVRRVARFWAALLGGEPLPEPKQGKARVHLDLLTDDLDAAIARVSALGGRETGQRHDYPEGSVVVLTDPEGTEFCVVAYSTRPRV